MLQHNIYVQSRNDKEADLPRLFLSNYKCVENKLLCQKKVTERDETMIGQMQTFPFH